MRRAWFRWLPAIAAPAIIAAGVLAGTIPARAGDPLPEKTPAEVLALLDGHATHTFSGTIEQSSELGLPALPAAGPSSGPASAGGAASVFELLAGEHTARVYMDGKTKFRVQVMDRMAEREIVRRGSDLWFYSSKDNSTAHLTLPAYAHHLPLTDPAVPGTPPAGPPARDNTAAPTPQELAEHLLAKLEPATAVSVGDDVEVAGRAAYNVVLEPRTDATLVGKVAIAVDGATGMPLSVQVTARGADSPSFRAGFTSLSFDVPDDSLFSFAPPPGSTVEELQAPDPGHGPLAHGTPGMHMTPDQLAAIHQHPARPTVTGKGWETVVGIPAAAADGNLAGSLLQDPLLSQAAVVVPGGRLLSTNLFNVLITDDGRIYAGMVPPDRLQAAASAAP
ncbi:LolA family protein [Pseudarthrobacter sp. NS4]|uniref:LolA family protein n=1 Tax=Pseudarthrobacter sp. NS4 TaxID=2973976 RepID=UPI002162C1EE|nr:hypothetical protein [Pseudarthrobacter sp. NS4]